MKLKLITAFVVAAAIAMLTAPTDAQTNAQTKRKRVVTSSGHTVFVSRENGRTRTHIIIQKRSYLDPGTETFPGEHNSSTDYVWLPNQRAGSVIDNTAFGLTTQSPLPGPWTLPGKNNPWIGY
jgi:hypothetical protein